MNFTFDKVPVYEEVYDRGYECLVRRETKGHKRLLKKVLKCGWRGWPHHELRTDGLISTMAGRKGRRLHKSMAD